MSLPDGSLPGSSQREVAAVPLDRPLTVPLLIRGSLDSGGFPTLPATFVLCVVIGFGGLLLRHNWFFAVVFWSLAAFIGVVTALVWLWLMHRRQWLEVTLPGFVLSHRDERRVYNDDQVVGLAQQTVPTANGQLKRRVVLEIATNEGTEHIDCRYLVPIARVDPLAAFFDRLIQGMARRTVAGLQQDVRLKGQGWSFDRHGLRRGSTIYPVEVIARCGFFDGRLCLWRAGEVRPFLRLPLSSRNVYALGQVLWHFIRQRPDHDRPLDQPLGRLLLERWNGSLPLGLMIVLGAVLIGLYCLVLGLSVERPPPPAGLFMFGLACLSMVGVGAMLAWYGWRGGLRFHEFGVAQPTWGGVRELMYPDIGEVVWKGDQVLVLCPAAGVDGPVLWFRSIFSKFDAEMAGMRDHLCRFLAQQWTEQMAHRPVTWTPRLRFLPDGLEYLPSSLLRSALPVTVPYEKTSYRLENNQFLLVVGEKVVHKERVALPNFFVGLLVLNGMYQRFQQPAVPGLDATLPAPRAALPGCPGPFGEHVRGAEGRPGGVTRRADQV
jgi:hypothetical protein